MLKLQGSLPRNITLAFSGGVDSVAVADFLKRNHAITLLFINHRTKASAEAQEFVLSFADKNNLPLQIRHISEANDTSMSKEEFWRIERYKIFHNVDNPVVTAHHLDDCVETWIWSSLHGQSKLIPYRNHNVIRPFLLNRKNEFKAWCDRNNLDWCEDMSNLDTSYMRNHIRHNMMPSILKVNPGIHKVIKKKLISRGTNV